MYVKFNNKLRELAEIRGFNLQKKAVTVIYGSGERDIEVFTDKDAEKLIFMVNYVLPGLGIVDVDHSYEHKEQIIETHDLTQAARAKKLKNLAQMAKAELDQQEVVEQAPFMMPPPGTKQ